MAQQFDIDLPAERVEPTPRWVRVRSGDRWIADSRAALLYVTYSEGVLPTYYFAEADVDHEAVQALPDGVAKRASAADDGLPPELDGHWTFAWNDDSVQWFEEAEQVFVHARDPRHRVDAIPSERHVVITREGDTLADSTRPFALFETNLPTRWYFPPEDVSTDLLGESQTRSRCPFKGISRFFTHGGRDIAWTYDDPIVENPRIKGLIAFFNEHVDMTIDGEPQPRPHTPWSTDATA